MAIRAQSHPASGVFTCQGRLPRGVVRHDELAGVPLLCLGLQAGELGLDGLVDLGPLLFGVVRHLPMRGETRARSEITQKAAFKKLPFKS